MINPETDFRAKRALNLCRKSFYRDRALKENFALGLFHFYYEKPTKEPSSEQIKKWSEAAWDHNELVESLENKTIWINDAKRRLDLIDLGKAILRDREFVKAYMMGDE